MTTGGSTNHRATGVQGTRPKFLWADEIGETDWDLSGFNGSGMPELDEQIDASAWAGYKPFDEVQAQIDSRRRRRKAKRDFERARRDVLALRDELRG